MAPLDDPSVVIVGLPIKAYPPRHAQIGTTPREPRVCNETASSACRRSVRRHRWAFRNRLRVDCVGPACSAASRAQRCAAVAACSLKRGIPPGNSPQSSLTHVGSSAQYGVSHDGAPNGAPDGGGAPSVGGAPAAGAVRGFPVGAEAVPPYSHEDRRPRQARLILRVPPTPHRFARRSGIAAAWRGGRL